MGRSLKSIFRFWLTNPNISIYITFFTHYIKFRIQWSITSSCYFLFSLLSLSPPLYLLSWFSFPLTFPLPEISPRSSKRIQLLDLHCRLLPKKHKEDIRQHRQQRWSKQGIRLLGERNTEYCFQWEIRFLKEGFLYKFGRKRLSCFH